MADNFALKVTDTLREYLKEIRTVLHDTESEAERHLQITSALEEIEGQEVKVATDVECSRILEVFIESAPTELLLQLVERIAAREALFTVACNPFGSHVLEKLLLQLQHALCGDEPSKALQIVSKMVQLVKEDLVDYITHKFATFFARRLLHLLTDGSGKGAAQSHAGNDVLLFHTELQQHLHSIVQEVCGHGFDSATLINLQRSTYASPFLQALVRAVSDKTQVSTMICHMLGTPPENSEQPATALSRLDPASLISQMKHKTASHMIEAIFLSCPPKLYDPIFKSIASSFSSLCTNPIANFAAQSLIAAAPAARNIGDIFHTLKASLEDCLLRNRSGVACLLVAACAAWRVECEECCAAVQAVFPDGAVQGLAMLAQDQTLAEALGAVGNTRRAPRLSVNGCIILKSMLAMPQSACRSITDALVALDRAAVQLLAADPSGARVLETVLKGSAPKPVKRKLVGLLQGSFVKLAKLGAASRLVESLFMWCNVPDKQVIAQPLADHLTELKASKFGEPLCQAFQLDLLKSSADEWSKRMTSGAKIKAQYEKLFADSIAKESKMKRKSKKRKGNDDSSVFSQADASARDAPAAFSATLPVSLSKRSKMSRQNDADADIAVGVGLDIDGSEFAVNCTEDGGVEHRNGEKEKVKIIKKKAKRQTECAVAEHENQEQEGAVVEGKTSKNKGKKVGGRVDSSSRNSGKRKSKSAGDAVDAEDVFKPLTDAKSVIDEVVAELAIGSVGGHGAKKTRKKGEGGGVDVGSTENQKEKKKVRDNLEKRNETKGDGGGSVKKSGEGGSGVPLLKKSKRQKEGKKHSKVET